MVWVVLGGALLVAGALQWQETAETTQHSTSMEAARALAEEWKQAVLDKGSFTELDRERQ